MPELQNLGHIDRALTNISVGYMQTADAYIADKIFPVIPVTKRSDTYFKYSKADFFRDEVQERGRAAESAGGTWNLEEADPYFCRKYAYHYDITQEEKTNYDQPINIDRDTTQWLSEKMLLKRETLFISKFFKSGVWGSEFVGKASPSSAGEIRKFSDALSDPVETVNNIMLTMAENSGKKPNFMIMAPDVFYALKRHDTIMDRIKYTQKGIITLELIASLFEIENIYVPWGIFNAGPTTPGYDEVKDSMKFLYKGSILLGYRTSRPALKEPTAGYIFSWTGLEGASAYGPRMVRLKMDQLGYGTERLEMEMAFDQKVICKDMGIFLKDLV